MKNSRMITPQEMRRMREASPSALSRLSKKDGMVMALPATSE